jgi:hypothetical protein
MFASKWLASPVGIALLTIAILVAVMSPAASAHGLTSLQAHATQTTQRAQSPNVGSCEWFLQQEDGFTTTLSFNGHNYSLLWDVTMYSEFNWATHGYCGQVYETVCMNTPSNYPGIPGRIWNQYYWSPDDNGFNYIGEATGVWNMVHYGRYCVSSPQFGLAGYDYLGIVSWLIIYDGTDSVPKGVSDSVTPVGRF